MSTTAHHLKEKEYFYDEHDKLVYHVLHKEEHGHNVKFMIENFETGKHTKKTYSHDHHLRTVEPEMTQYTLSHVVLDEESQRLFLSLFDKDMNLRNDLYLDEPVLVDQLVKLTKEVGDDVNKLHVKTIKLNVPAMHRADNDIGWERIVDITNIDFSHLYDKHHGHHHVHH